MDYKSLTSKELQRISRGDNVETRLCAVIEIERRKKEMPHLPSDWWTRRNVIITSIIGVLTIAVAILVPVFLPEIRSVLHLSEPVHSAMGSPSNHMESTGTSPANSGTPQESLTVSKPAENAGESLLKRKTNRPPIRETPPSPRTFSAPNSASQIPTHPKPVSRELVEVPAPNPVQQVPAQTTASNAGNGIKEASSLGIEQPFEPGQFLTDSYRLKVGVGDRWAENGQQRGTGTSSDPIHYETYYMIILPVTIESLSKIYFHFEIQPNSCYLSDENANIWKQETPDSVGISSSGIEIHTAVPIKSLFYLTAKGDTIGTRLTLVCSEQSPKHGRQIVIRGITSH